MDEDFLYLWYCDKKKHVNKNKSEINFRLPRLAIVAFTFSGSSSILPPISSHRGDLLIWRLLSMLKMK